MWAYTQDADFTLGNYLFGLVKLTKNGDFDKYKYSVYGIGFDACGSFSLSDSSGFSKNIIIFGADMSSFLHDDNREKDILIPGKGLTQGLDDTALNGEKEYEINFSRQHKKFCISLYYNRANSYLLVNGVEIYKCKKKDSEINSVLLRLGNVSKYFSVDNLKKDWNIHVCLRFFRRL